MITIEDLNKKHLKDGSLKMVKTAIKRCKLRVVSAFVGILRVLTEALEAIFHILSLCFVIEYYIVYVPLQNYCTLLLHYVKF